MPSIVGYLIVHFKNCSVELYAEGEERAIYSGIVQRAQSQEENGYRQLRLELGSGSLLMDMEKEKRTFQDISMTYGQVITRIASEAGMMAVYPRLLDETAIGFPVIQYRETDWEFIRRLASRFGMAVYPETTLGGGKLTVDLPQTGNAGELRCLSYTARIDRKFYQAGGEQEGRSREQYRTYEVRSRELRRVGDAVTWDGKHLFVCARKAELRDGMLEFVYILSGREWTWQKRLGNPKISGMSLLGTVEGCSGETVRLLLDIDRGRPAQLSYPWTWVPATGNLMYLMPQVGTRVSLYFKGEEETDAIAVNCIRSGDGCAQADYRDKSLTTEHGMQLRLNQGDMGIVSLKEKLLLDDMEGIRIAGSGSLHILAAGEVKIAASEVRVAGTGGVLLYEGTAEADREGNIVVAPQGKIELSAEDGERAIHNRGKEVTYYLAWEHEDLSHPSNRYRDALQQKDYDWMKLGTHVAAGLMIAGGIAALAAGGVLLLGAAAATAIKIGMTVFLAGSLYVGEQALSDIRSGRVSDLDQYTRKAVAGSVVGFLTGASGLLMAEASLGGVLALGFGEGLVGSIVTQKLLNEDGEIDWGVAIAEAGFSAVTAGFAWKEGRSVRGVGGGSEAGRMPRPGDDNFIGPLTNLDDHLIRGDGIGVKKRGVLGAHNMTYFDSTLESTGFSLEDLKVGSPTPHPTIEGIYTQQYRVPAYDGQGNFIGFKNIPVPKTIYDPAIISNRQMLDWGQEAMQNGVITGRIIEGTASNGLQFRGFIEDGVVTNFFPVLPE